MGNNKNLHGHLFALTANVMWGLMSPIGKSALQEFSADSYHDCGSHLSERADYEQESTGYFRGSYGSAYPYYEQSGSE